MDLQQSNTGNPFDAYAIWTEEVAKYPPSAEPFYLALGIADEMGELDNVADDDQENIVKEAGDVLWYIARYVTRVLKMPFSDAVASARAMDYNGNFLQSYIGAICGVEKKRIRDGADWTYFQLTIKETAAHNAIVNLIKALDERLIDAGSSLEAALSVNVSKLTSRLEQGTIQGDGDNR